MFDVPKVEVMPERHFAGLTRRYDEQTRVQIPAQWGELMAAGPLPDAVPDAWYGVCYNFGEGMSFDYLCGQEVTTLAGLPGVFAAVTVPSGAFARFATTAHISRMQEGWEEIYGDWLKQPAYPWRPGAAIEFYPPEFNGETGEGGWEIWMPVVG